MEKYHSSLHTAKIPLTTQVVRWFKDNLLDILKTDKEKNAIEKLETDKEESAIKKLKNLGYSSIETYIDKQSILFQKQRSERIETPEKMIKESGGTYKEMTDKLIKENNFGDLITDPYMMQDQNLSMWVDKRHNFVNKKNIEHLNYILFLFRNKELINNSKKEIIEIINSTNESELIKSVELSALITQKIARLLFSKDREITNKTLKKKLSETQRNEAIKILDKLGFRNTKEVFNHSIVEAILNKEIKRRDQNNKKISKNRLKYYEDLEFTEKHSEFIYKILLRSQHYGKIFTSMSNDNEDEFVLLLTQDQRKTILIEYLAYSLGESPQEKQKILLENPFSIYENLFPKWD